MMGFETEIKVRQIVVSRQHEQTCEEANCILQYSSLTIAVTWSKIHKISNLTV